MLVYVSFNMFDYTQQIIVFKDSEEISRTYATFDTLPQRIVDTCYNFNAFDVKIDDFIQGLPQQVALIEASKYSVNKIKFV